MAREGIRSSGTVSATDSRYAGLRRFNLIMGFLHLIQGIFMIVVSNATTYPIFTNYLSFDVATRSLKPNPQLFLNLRFGPAVACFPAHLGRGPLLPVHRSATGATCRT